MFMAALLSLQENQADWLLFLKILPFAMHLILMISLTLSKMMSVIS